jgi:hypothetical protein
MPYFCLREVWGDLIPNNLPIFGDELLHNATFGHNPLWLVRKAVFEVTIGKHDVGKESLALHESFLTPRNMAWEQGRIDFEKFKISPPLHSSNQLPSENEISSNGPRPNQRSQSF